MYSVQSTQSCIVFGVFVVWSYILWYVNCECALFYSFFLFSKQICESLVDFLMLYNSSRSLLCCYCVLLWLLLFSSLFLLVQISMWMAYVKSKEYFMIFLCIRWLVCGHFKPTNRWTMRGKINISMKISCIFVLVILHSGLLNLQYQSKRMEVHRDIFI